MRKTRLVIQPTRCLHGIGFLLLYMSCPVFGDWGLVQPESAAAQRAYSLQRESAKIVVKDPPDARVTQQLDTFAWAYKTDSAGRSISSNERRWLDVRNQRMSPERSDFTQNDASRLLREVRQNERQNTLQRRVGNRMENSRRLSRQPKNSEYRLHLEERVALPSRRLVRSEAQSDSGKDMRVNKSERQITQIRSNQRLLKNSRITSNHDEQQRRALRIDERSEERASRTSSLRRNDNKSENVRERHFARNERKLSLRQSFQENDRSLRENMERRQRDNRINIAEGRVMDRRNTLIRSARSIDERREESGSLERRELASRTVDYHNGRFATNSRERSITRNEVRAESRKSSSERDQQRFPDRHIDIRQARDNRISNSDEALNEGRGGRRVAQRGERQSSHRDFIESSIAHRDMRQNNERREVERSSSRMNSSIRRMQEVRESRMDRSERQNTRAEDRRELQENSQNRINIRNGEREELSRRENTRRESEVVRKNQGNSIRTQRNNERRINGRRSDQDALIRSSLSQRNNQEIETSLRSYRNNEENRFERRESRNINRRSQDHNIREYRHRQENSLLRNTETRLPKTVRDVQDQREMNRREERHVSREKEHRQTRRDMGKTGMEREVRDIIRSQHLIRNQRFAMALEKESVMSNNRNEITLSSRKENNNKREITKAVDLSKQVRNGQEMFTKKPYNQDSIDQMFEDNNNNWISYKKIAENCLLGAIAYFVTTRNPKIAY